MLIYDIAPGQDIPDICAYKWPHGFVVRKRTNVYVFAPRFINGMIAFFAEGKTIQEAEKKAVKMWIAPLLPADAPNTVENALLVCVGYLQCEGVRQIDFDLIKKFINDFYHEIIISDARLRVCIDGCVNAGELERWPGENNWFYRVVATNTVNPIEDARPDTSPIYNPKHKKKFTELLATVKELTEARIPTTKQAIQRAMFRSDKERWQKRYLVWAVRDGLLVKGEAKNGEVIYLIP